MECLVTDCKRDSRARGWCTLHYQRWKLTGDPEGTKRRGPEPDRFWRKVERADGCWLWRGGRSSTSGYGVFSRGDRRGPIMAHRWAYESVRGSIPPGMQIDHLCRVRLCVRPDHLEAVPQRENLLRGDTITARNAAKTHCPAGHPYTAQNTYRYAKKGRVCKACSSERSRRAYVNRRRA